MRRNWCAVLLAAAVGTGVGLSGTIGAAGRYPAAQSAADEPQDPVATLNREIQAGRVRLPFDGSRGYLTAVLRALDVPVESQTLVFSETSFQTQYINPGNPRALYFNDTVAVGWVMGGDLLEVIAQDPRRGAMLYSLEQQEVPQPQLSRDDRCRQCHETAFTAGVPGWLTMSTLPLSDDPADHPRGWQVDHRTPIEDRWGGWFVTGPQAPRVHLGNVQVNHAERSYMRLPEAPVLASVDVDRDAYLSSSSDVAALLVLNHQTHMLNLLTRLAAEARVVELDGVVGSRFSTIVRDVADYLLFVDEAPLPRPVRGSSAFAETFSARGPRDERGRSFRELDLTTRLLRYPCSYLVHSPSFDALPALARDAVYARIWRVLSGEDPDPRYARMPLADRQAVGEILRATKAGLPDYFQRPLK